MNRDLKDAQALQSELQRKTKDYEALCSEGEALIATSEQHQDGISDLLDDVHERWRELSDGMDGCYLSVISVLCIGNLQWIFSCDSLLIVSVFLLTGIDDRVRGLEDLSSHLHDYHDNHHEIASALQKQKVKLDKHMDLGSPAKDSKHLDKITVS